MRSLSRGSFQVCSHQTWKPIQQVLLSCSSTALRSWSAASVLVELCRTLRFCVSYVVGLRWITAGRGCWDDSSGTPPLADEPSGRDASNSQKLGLSPGLQEFANHLCLQGPVRNFPEAWHFHGRKSFIDCRWQGLPQPCHAEGPVGGLIPYQPAHVLNQWRWCPRYLKSGFWWFLNDLLGLKQPSWWNLNSLVLWPPWEVINDHLVTLFNHGAQFR